MEEMGCDATLFRGREWVVKKVKVVHGCHIVQLLQRLASSGLIPGLPVCARRVWRLVTMPRGTGPCARPWTGRCLSRRRRTAWRTREWGERSRRDRVERRGRRAPAPGHLPHRVIWRWLRPARIHPPLASPQAAQSLSGAPCANARLSLCRPELEPRLTATWSSRQLPHLIPWPNAPTRPPLASDPASCAPGRPGQAARCSCPAA